MSSRRRIESSRANGAKSRGPVTPAGRLKSSANNLRHRLLAGIVVIEEEKPETFTTLLAALTSEFNPQTETQRALVETMAVARWRLIRLWGIERATLQGALEKHDPAEYLPASRVAAAFRSLADESRTLDLLHRYETRFDRQFSRALNLLIKLGGPDNPLTQSCRSNPIPAPDTPEDAPADAPPPPAAADNIDWGTTGAASAAQPSPGALPPLSHGLARATSFPAMHLEPLPALNQSRHIEISPSNPPIPCPRIGYDSDNLFPIDIRSPQPAAAPAIKVLGSPSCPAKLELGDDDLSIANGAAKSPADQH